MKLRGNGYLRPMDKSGRCRRWQLRIKTDSREFTRTFHGTKREASAALDAFRAEVAAMPEPHADFHAYAARWLELRRASGQLEVNTLQNLARDVRTLTNATEAGTALADMDAAYWNTKLLEIKNGRNASGRILSNTYMADIYDTVKAIFDLALLEKEVAEHPLRLLKRPVPDTPEKPCMPPDALDALLDALEAEPLDGRVMAVYLICEMGLRRAEACALMRDDFIDDGARYLLNVNKAVKDRNGTIGRTKSDSGTRLLPMRPRAASMCRRWLAMSDSQYICCNTEGGLLRPQNLYRWFEKKKIEWNIPDMTLHLLRHSNLSMMARYMGAYELKTWAGWSTVEPARVYIHDDLTALEAAVAASIRGNFGAKEKQAEANNALTCGFTWSGGQDLNLRPNSRTYRVCNPLNIDIPYNACSERKYGNGRGKRK